MEDLVNFELAKKLKGKGFKEKVIKYYGKHENIFDCHPPLDMNDADYRCSAPTISQVLKWLRDEKKLYVGVTYLPKVDGSQDFFYATIQYIGDYQKTIYTNGNDSYDNWEEAALNGIEYVLNNLI